MKFHYNPTKAEKWWDDSFKRHKLSTKLDRSVLIEKLLYKCIEEFNFNSLIYCVHNSLFLSPFSSLSQPILLSTLSFNKSSPRFLIQYIGGFIPHLIPNCIQGSKDEPLLFEKELIVNIFESLKAFKDSHIEYIISLYCAIHLTYPVETLNHQALINFLSQDDSYHSVISKLTKFKIIKP